MVNATDIDSITMDQAKDVGVSLFKKVIFFSGVVVNWVVERFNEWGVPLKDYQASVVFFIVDLVLLYLALKFIAKPLIKVAIAVLLVWFMVGFFVPIS